MSEKQEKVWVVMRHTATGWSTTTRAPVKVFDDRADARVYAKRLNARSRSAYTVSGVLKG